MAQHRYSQELLLFGFDAGCTASWHWRCAATAMDRGTRTGLLVLLISHRNAPQIGETLRID